MDSRESVALCFNLDDNLPAAPDRLRTRENSHPHNPIARASETRLSTAPSDNSGHSRVEGNRDDVDDRDYDRRNGE